jgi:hypothetical protein
VDKSIGDGFEALRARATPWRHDDIPPVPPDDANEKTLNEARHAIAIWPLRQRLTPDGPKLIASLPPPLPTNLSVECSTFDGPFVEWPPTQCTLLLPPAEDESDLIRFRLRLCGLESLWIQRAPLDPPPLPERDHRALSRLLDPKTFLAWLRALLTGQDAGEGGGAWDDDTSGEKHGFPSTGATKLWAPTLEDALKAWRPEDPARLRAANRHVKNYLAFIRRHFPPERDAADWNALRAFEKAWEVIRQELLR